MKLLKTVRFQQVRFPPEKKQKTAALLQYEFLAKNAYKYTSDDLIFNCYVIKNDISDSEKEIERQKFFSKGQPCLRCSSLAKTYGFGFHHNEDGKVAMVPLESLEYQSFLINDSVKKVKAMRLKK